METLINFFWPITFFNWYGVGLISTVIIMETIFKGHEGYKELKPFGRFVFMFIMGTLGYISAVFAIRDLILYISKRNKQ